MEIIHTYMSDENEICVISDGSTIHLADKNDLAVESPKVGTVVRPSQMNEVYLEMPISVLQEAARRSEIVIDPDSEEEESSDDSEEGAEDEEEAELPPWQPLAREQFFREYAALDAGVDVNVLINFPMKVRWDEGATSSSHTTDGDYGLDEALQAQGGYRTTVNAFNQRIKNLIEGMAKFTTDQNDLGHDLGGDSVENFLNDELAKSKSDLVADAAE